MTEWEKGLRFSSKGTKAENRGAARTIARNLGRAFMAGILFQLVVLERKKDDEHTMNLILGM